MLFPTHDMLKAWGNFTATE